MGVISLAKKMGVTKRLKAIPGFERAAAWLYYGLFRPPYFSRAVRIDVGGAGPVNLDYRFGHFGYEHFGDEHNGCFRAWLELCRGKKAVFDVGAHIGLYALSASRVVSPEGKVYAFEPASANQVYLRRHLAYNGIRNVEICPHLLGADFQESVEFFESRAVDAMNSVVLVKDPRQYAKVAKRQTTLDAFCLERKTSPEVVKIDVEGSELNVLRGARDLLKRRRAVLILSVHPSRLEKMGQSSAQLMDFLREFGYAPYEASGRRADDMGFGEYVIRPEG